MTAYSLTDLCLKMRDTFDTIEEIYLFGSRRYGTRSPRSDIDMLVMTSTDVRSAEVRTFISENCPALDIFLVDRGRAVSVQNEGSVQAPTNSDLVAQLDAVRIWSKDIGAIEVVGVDMIVNVSDGVEFIATALSSLNPHPSRWAKSLAAHRAQLDHDGLPADIIVGTSTEEVANSIASVVRRAVASLPLPVVRGQYTKMQLRSEYDFQNLFWIVVKPWLPGLRREEVSVVYDGAEKKADFHALESKLIVELKHVKDTGSKSLVEQTIGGLTRLYMEKPAVEVLMFMVLVDRGVAMDDALFENRHSIRRSERRVLTHVVRNDSRA